MDIDVSKKGVRINGVLLTALNIDVVSGLFGAEPSKKEAILVWDRLGIIGYPKKENMDELEELRFFIAPDKDWSFTPSAVFKGKLTCNGLPILEGGIKEKVLREAYMGLRDCWGDYQIYLNLSREVQSQIDSFSFEQQLAMEATDAFANLIRNAVVPFEVIGITHNPKKPKPQPSDKYLPVKAKGAHLAFDNFNFKLVVMQVLMYDKELLQPKFDVYEFCEERGKDAMDYYSTIPAVKKWFEAYEIPVVLASEVETLYMDGGNDIYLQLNPNWDGEGNTFDIKDVTEGEFAPFVNLKQISGTAILVSKKAIRKFQSMGGWLRFEVRGMRYEVLTL